MSDKQILYSSDEAAKYTTGIKGWVSSRGHYYGENEHVARYDGCTHIDCTRCGKPTRVGGYTICDECRDTRSIEKYNEMPKLKWDGNVPLYSDSSDRYFFDGESLHDHLIDTGDSIESLRLIICKPNNLREIDSDYFCDDLYEDDVLPFELENALEVLNKVIREQPPASWSPGKYAAVMSDDLLTIPDFLRNAENLAIEREKLCKNNPPCPKCDTEQVQIINVGIQEWKCRHCKTTFFTDYEV